MIPVLSVAEDLHKAYAAFHQSPGDQATLRIAIGVLLADAVHLLDGFGLGGQIEGFFRGFLHARCESITGEPCGEIVFARVFGKVLLVELLE